MKFSEKVGEFIGSVFVVGLAAVFIAALYRLIKFILGMWAEKKPAGTGSWKGLTSFIITHWRKFIHGR